MPCVPECKRNYDAQVGRRSLNMATSVKAEGTHRPEREPVRGTNHRRPILSAMSRSLYLSPPCTASVR